MTTLYGFHESFYEDILDSSGEFINYRLNPAANDKNKNKSKSDGENSNESEEDEENIKQEFTIV